ncbi:hypothetical protein GCM10019016_126880 [Streptomyces prasinosporus]|uniref:Uncharacterized protein n=1 Tax=Streptomyces prasinosporus TaxID=68256 RepID=A0ABP6UEF4_9ACTN
MLPLRDGRGKPPPVIARSPQRAVEAEVQPGLRMFRGARGEQDGDTALDGTDHGRGRAVGVELRVGLAGRLPGTCRAIAGLVPDRTVTA